MQITHNINLPPTYGKTVETYLKTLEKNTNHAAFTVSDDLKIIDVKGRIENNLRYHYHHNYDNSEDELFVTYIASGKKEKRWWTIDFAEAKAIRAKNIRSWKTKLKAELKKYE